jgi:hypothetical protein
MTGAGFPPAVSEYKHMRLASELDKWDLMTQRFKD